MQSKFCTGVYFKQTTSWELGCPSEEVMAGQGYVDIVEYRGHWNWGKVETGGKVVGGRQKSSSVGELQSRRHLITFPSFFLFLQIIKCEHLLLPFCATVLEPVHASKLSKYPYQNHHIINITIHHNTCRYHF